jgi:hypothetical protein
MARDWHGEHPQFPEGGNAIWEWERWIQRDPERGWQVLEQLVARAPLDADVMDMAAWRVPQLINRDFATYSVRVLGLLKHSSYLDALLGPQFFVEAAYGDAQPYDESEQLAERWLQQSRASDKLRRLDSEIKQDHVRRLEFVLELIEQGPLHGFDADDVGGELHDVLRLFGSAVISDIERAAADSVAVRRAIWECRHRQGEISDELWSRFQAAAAGTSACNSQPSGRAHPVEPWLSERLDAWFRHEVLSAAYEEVVDLIRKEPEKGWRAMVAIIERASPEELGYCGAALVEELIREYPEQFIERIEELASRSASFRDALAASWITLEDVPDALARRCLAASGGRLQVLDAPPGWADAT